MDSFLKALSPELIVLSCLGLSILAKKKPYSALYLFSLMIFSYIWRLFSRSTSSRYYIVFFIYGLFLSVYFTYFLLSTKRKEHVMLFILVCLLFPIYQTISVFHSFRNNYVYDVLEEINNKILCNNSNAIIYYDNKYGRVKYDNDFSKASTRRIGFSDNSIDIINFYIKYLTYDGLIYVLSSKKNSSTQKDNNQFFLVSQNNIFHKIGHFITSHNIKKNVNLYRLEKYSDDLKIRIDYNDLLISPGRLTFSNDMINCSNDYHFTDTGLVITGKLTRIYSKKRILITNNECNSIIKIKNIGNTPTQLYIGYEIFSEEGLHLDGRNYPFDISEPVLCVKEHVANDPRIVVDHYPKWGKNCYLSLNAKDDFSDIPTTNLADGKVIDVKKTANGFTEIIMDRPQSQTIPQGTKVRINGFNGSYIYTNKKELHPNEEYLFHAKIKKDNDFFQYSSDAFSRGVYYVIPLILSYSSNRKQDNTIFIEDYSISY